jgi:hypothetical protein
MKTAKISKNHDQAPVSAEFVRQMREVFGDVKVLYVKENNLEMGEPAEEGAVVTWLQQ